MCRQNHGVFACADAEAAQASLATLQEELAGMESSIADAKKARHPLFQALLAAGGPGAVTGVWARRCCTANSATRSTWRTSPDRGA